MHRKEVRPVKLHPAVIWVALGLTLAVDLPLALGQGSGARKSGLLESQRGDDPAGIEAIALYPEPVRDGTSRQVDDDPHAWVARPGDHVAYVFPETTEVHEVTLALDSDLKKGILYSWNDYPDEPDGVDPQHGRRLLPRPPMMPKTFHVDGLIDGEWQTLETITGNCQRFVRVKLDRRVEGVRFVLDDTWGGEESRVYSFYVD